MYNESFISQAITNYAFNHVHLSKTQVSTKIILINENVLIDI